MQLIKNTTGIFLSMIYYGILASITFFLYPIALSISATYFIEHKFIHLIVYFFFIGITFGGLYVPIIYFQSLLSKMFSSVWWKLGTMPIAIYTVIVNSINIFDDTYFTSNFGFTYWILFHQIVVVLFSISMLYFSIIGLFLKND
jgi:hypothetical protein